MELKAIHHVSLAVRDLAKAREFYEGTLGLARITRPEMGLGGAWYRLGGNELHLIELPAEVDVGNNPKNPMPLANHIAFQISDYEATVRFFESCNFELVTTDAERGQLWLQDPDGNILEFIAI